MLTSIGNIIITVHQYTAQVKQAETAWKMKTEFNSDEQRNILLIIKAALHVLHVN
jgi:hypothetical protein